MTSDARPIHPTRLIAGTIVVALALAAIALATLGDGDPLALETTGRLCLVCGSHGGIDVVLNLLLFVPLGIGMALIGASRGAAIALGFTTSAGVELAQLLVFVGRAPTLSDLLTNTFGTLLGWIVVATWRRWWRPDPVLARRLATSAWIVWVAIVAATAYGLQPSTATRFRINTLPPDDAFVRPFEGAMREWMITGSSASGDSAAVLRGTNAPQMSHGTTAAVSSRAVRRVLGADRIEVTASVHAMLPPGKLRPLVIVHDDRWRALLVLGQQRRGLVLRIRTRASDLRFRSPELALSDAFPARIPSGDDPHRGPVVDAAATITARALTVGTRGAAGARSLRMPRSPFVGWTMLAPQWIRYDERGAAMTALWIAGLLAPLGYWARRSVPHGAGARGTVLLVLAVSVAVILPIVVAARIATLSLGGLGAWSAAAGAVALGWLLAWGLQRDRTRHSPLARGLPASQNTLP